LEASRAELREIRSTAQRQADHLHMKDVEIVALRTELRDMREAQLSTRNKEAEDRCKVLELQVENLQAELSLKASKEQEALSMASSANEAEQRCKSLQLQVQRLESDLSVNQAKLQEALKIRLSHAGLDGSHAEERYKVLEAKVQQQEADLAKTRPRSTELEGRAEQLRTRREFSEDVGGLGACAGGAWDGAEQTAKATEVATSRAGSPVTGSASATQRRTSTPSGTRSARFRDEIRTARALSNNAPADRYEELRQYRRLILSSDADV